MVRLGYARIYEVIEMTVTKLRNRIMTVAELIAELSKLDPNAKVLVDCPYDHTVVEEDVVEVRVDNKGIVHIEVE